MSFANFFRALFGKRQKCSRCDRMLEPIKKGESLFNQTQSKRASSTMICMRCGNLICENCRGIFGFGMMGGCKNCGGTEFSFSQMWMYM